MENIRQCRRRKGRRVSRGGAWQGSRVQRRCGESDPGHELASRRRGLRSRQSNQSGLGCAERRPSVGLSSSKMTHGTGFLAKYSSFETVIAGLHPRFGRFLCSLLRTAAATLGVGVSRGWLSVADSCSLIRERPYLFWRLCYYVGRLPAYLMMLILHWAWGWSALALAAALLLFSIGMAVIFRFRIVKPFFPTTLAEFQKDREWLKHTTKSSK
jgi:hypothetical protein